jgi:hypothetical protein
VCARNGAHCARVNVMNGGAVGASIASAEGRVIPAE